MAIKPYEILSSSSRALVRSRSERGVGSRKAATGEELCVLHQRKEFMISFSGIGTTLYGKRDYDKNDGSYIATKWFIFLLLPIFPIKSYRVWPVQGAKFSGLFFGVFGYTKQYQLKPVPLNWRQVILTYAVGWGAFFLGVQLLIWLTNPQSTGSELSRPSLESNFKNNQIPESPANNQQSEEEWGKEFAAADTAFTEGADLFAQAVLYFDSRNTIKGFENNNKAILKLQAAENAQKGSPPEKYKEITFLLGIAIATTLDAAEALNEAFTNQDNVQLKRANAIRLEAANRVKSYIDARESLIKSLIK